MHRFTIISLLAVFSLLAFGETRPAPGPKAFHIHIAMIEHTTNGFMVRALNGTVEYRMHCQFTSESCHMLGAGMDYVAENSKPAGHLVVYGVDDGPTEYILDFEQELAK